MRFKVVREPKQCAHAPPQLNFTKHFLFECLFFQKLLLLENYGGLAQLGERLHGMQEVTGSIPVFSTNEEQNEHEVTIQMVGNVFVLFCEIPSV